MAKIDDGSLSFLNIPRDTKDRSFNCDVINQSKLVNKTFWVYDFLEDIPTRYTKAKGGSGQTLVKIKMREDDEECDAKKFFTGSNQILYICQEIKKRNAFPRRVTLGCSGNHYYFE